MRVGNRQPGKDQCRNRDYNGDGIFGFIGQACERDCRYVNHNHPLQRIEGSLRVCYFPDEVCHDVTVAALILAGLAIADPHGKNFKASLDGYHETSLSSPTAGTGSFRARLNHQNGYQLTYELQYQGKLERGLVLFAHVHLGQMGTTGGVMFFLCGGGGQAACPASPRQRSQEL